MAANSGSEMPRLKSQIAEDARELAKYDERYKEFKHSVFLIITFTSIALAFLLAGFLIPRTPQRHRTFCQQMAVAWFFASAYGTWLHLRNFGWSVPLIAKPNQVSPCADRC